MSVFPYYSAAVRGRGYHTHASCPFGARIPREDRQLGEDGLLQCTTCVTLDELQWRGPDHEMTFPEPRTSTL